MVEDEEEAVRQAAADAVGHAASSIGLGYVSGLDPEAAVRLLHDVTTRVLGALPVHVAYLTSRLIPIDPEIAPKLAHAWVEVAG